MAKSSAWIVTDDVGLAGNLGAWLEENMGCPLSRLSFAAWKGGKQLSGHPKWILLDLRSPSAWPVAIERQQNCKKLAGQSVPVVAFIENGIPLEHANWADAVPAALINWPLASFDDLSRILHDAASTERNRQMTQVGESRLLQGTTGRFLTFTPELFPVVENLRVAAEHDFTILLVGETGTGKTTLARMIHELSPRRDQRFLPVACGALPGDLIDSDLFGHMKGSFTGADRTKPGKFDAADQGTILLDEIDVLGHLQQAKLLRVIETGEFEPVGSNETHKVNVRSIVASNVCLETLIERNQFRSDLFYRLNEVKFEIPPLRRRPRDIVPLAVDIIYECCREHGLSVQHVHPEFIETLKAYNWPGNIRELRNEVRRAVLFSRDGIVTPQPLSPVVHKEAQRVREQVLRMPSLSGLADVVGQTEQELIEHMLETQNFNRAATARALGISRVTLYNKIRKYRIQVDEDQQEPRGE